MTTIPLLEICFWNSHRAINVHSHSCLSALSSSYRSHLNWPTLHCITDKCQDCFIWAWLSQQLESSSRQVWRSQYSFLGIQALFQVKKYITDNIMYVVCEDFRDTLVTCKKTNWWQAFKRPLTCETFKGHFGNKQAHYMNPNKEKHDLNPDRSWGAWH